MRPDTITIAIFEKYNPEELAQVAQQMAQAQSDLESVESEKKVSDAAFNERIKKFAADVSTLAKRYNKGGETAQIGCDIKYDVPEAGKKSFVRMDSGETIETHEMTREEKQETIQFPLVPSAEDVNRTIESPTSKEEVTRLCEKTQGCIYFADHDGPCALERPEAGLSAGPETPAA